MSKKTLNIASICLVALLVVFVITKKDDIKKGYTMNIGVDGEVIDENKTLSETYQDQLLKALFEQNIKSFEAVNESFKRKPFLST
jgi:hypothetical protein